MISACRISTIRKSFIRLSCEGRELSPFDKFSWKIGSWDCRNLRRTHVTYQTSAQYSNQPCLCLHVVFEPGEKLLNVLREFRMVLQFLSQIYHELQVVAANDVSHICWLAQQYTALLQDRLKIRRRDPLLSACCLIALRTHNAALRNVSTWRQRLTGRNLIVFRRRGPFSLLSSLLSFKIRFVMQLTQSNFPKTELTWTLPGRRDSSFEFRFDKTFDRAIAGVLDGAFWMPTLSFCWAPLVDGRMEEPKRCFRFLYIFTRFAIRLNENGLFWT